VPSLLGDTGPRTQYTHLDEGTSRITAGKRRHVEAARCAEGAHHSTMAPQDNGRLDVLHCMTARWHHG